MLPSVPTMASWFSASSETTAAPSVRKTMSKGREPRGRRTCFSTDIEPGSMIVIVADSRLTTQTFSSGEMAIPSGESPVLISLTRRRVSVSIAVTVSLSRFATQSSAPSHISADPVEAAAAVYSRPAGYTACDAWKTLSRPSGARRVILKA
jgi:hypothetical protein